MLRSKMLRSSNGGNIIEFVGYNAKTDAGGNWSLDISGIDIREGDIGILGVGIQGSSLTAYPTATGFTTIQEGYTGANLHRASILGRTFTGLEGGLINGTALSSNGTVIIFTVWRNAILPAFDVQSRMEYGTNDPGVLSTEEDGATSIGDAVLAFAFVKSITTVTITTPADYTLIVSGGNTSVDEWGWAAYSLTPDIPDVDLPSLEFTPVTYGITCVTRIAPIV